MNSKFIAALTSADTPPLGGQRTMRQSVNTTNKTNLPSPCESKEDEVALRVHALYGDAPHPIAIRMKGPSGPLETHLRTRSSRGGQSIRRNTSQTSVTDVQGLDERA